jgi:glutathione S-transferase
MPRPDIARLGIKYRRIPLLSIGRDVYLDTRLILQKLESMYPSKARLGADGGEHLAIQRLFEIYMVDSIFQQATKLLPASLPMVRDKKFQEDRADFYGPRGPKGIAHRPTAINEIKAVMRLLEDTLLADGRDWILNTQEPSLADIEAVWPVHWLTGMRDALPQDQISASHFPKVYAWVARFQKAVSIAKASQPKPATVDGKDAQHLIINSGFNEEEKGIAQNDSLVAYDKLQKGQDVQLWPTDSGSTYKEHGKLVGIDDEEIVIEVQGESSSGLQSSVRVHAPRHGFSVRASSRL